MTGGIGCGDAVSLCDAIRRVPDENALLCVLPGRNEALRQADDAMSSRMNSFTSGLNIPGLGL